MSELPVDEPSTEPFWRLLGMMIFLITLLFLTVFFDNTIGLFDISNKFRQIPHIILGGILKLVELE